MGIKKIDLSLCQPGCGICVDECPYDVFRLNEATGQAEIRYPDDCHECYYLHLCAKNCPPGAIEAVPEIASKRWFAC